MELSPKQQVKELVGKSSNILIALKVDIKGDDLSSALALRQILQKMGKDVTVCSVGEPNEKFKFLAGCGELQKEISQKTEVLISIDTKEDKVDSIYYKNEADKLNIFLAPKNKINLGNITIKERKANFDLIIVLNSPDLESLGSIYEKNAKLFFESPIVNIDKHASNEYFGSVNWVEITASSTSEILCSLAQNLEVEMDSEIATCLLTGIIDETDNFLSSSVSPATLMAASELIKKGADREKIIRYLYKTKSLSSLKLWGRVMAKLNYDLDYRIAWALITKEDFAKTGAQEEDIYFAANEIANVSVDINLLLIFYANGKGLLRIVENHIKPGHLQSLMEILGGKISNGNVVAFDMGLHSPEGTMESTATDIQIAISETLVKLKNRLER